MRHNYHARVGELDLITLDPARVLHAVEVRNWSVGGLVTPLESLTAAKQARMRRTLRHFLFETAEPHDDDARDLRARLNEWGAPDAYALDVSFDLVWVRRAPADAAQTPAIEYFPNLF